METVMDSQHRHELKENDLADFLLNFRQWWAQHGKKTLIMIVVIAVVVTLWRLRSATAEVRHEQAWSNLAASSGPDAFLAIAAEADNATLRNLARVRGADLWALKATLPQAELTTIQMLDQAEETYQEVISDPQAPLVLRLNAMLGLAAVGETRGDWDKTDQWYDRVIEQAGGLYPAHRAEAESRRVLVEQLKKPLTFAPEPAPDTVTNATGAVGTSQGVETPVVAEGSSSSSAESDTTAASDGDRSDGG